MRDEKEKSSQDIAKEKKEAAKLVDHSAFSNILQIAKMAAPAGHFFSPVIQTAQQMVQTIQKPIDFSPINLLLTEILSYTG